MQFFKAKTLPGLSPTLVDATSAATVVVSVPFTKIYVTGVTKAKT